MSLCDVDIAFSPEAIPMERAQPSREDHSPRLVSCRTRHERPLLARRRSKFVRKTAASIVDLEQWFFNIFKILRNDHLGIFLLPRGPSLN